VGGNLTVNATESVRLIGRAADGQIVTGLFTKTENGGDAGNLSIKTDNLIVRNEALIGSDTFGDGAGGNLSIETENLIIRDRSRVGSDTFGDGAGGNLTINTGNIIVRDEAQISSGTRDRGKGAGGNLTVNATDSVQLIGKSADSRFPTGLFTETESRGDAGNLSIDTRNLIVRNGAVVRSGTLGEGAGGSLSIKTGNLIIRDGAQVSSGTVGEGAGGNLIVNATGSVRVIGRSADSWVSSGLFSQTNNSGDAGNLSIDTRNLIVSDGARISSGTRGSGAGGNLSIKTGNLIVSDEGQVSSGTVGEGAGGNLTVDAADSVRVIGRSADGRFASGLSTDTTNLGKAGHLTIKTGNLIVSDGGQVSSGTFGEGAGGNLTVDAADSVQVIGTLADSRFASGLFTDTANLGDAGNLSIDTGNLLVSDGAVVSSATRNQGAGGSLVVNATDSIQIIGTSADGEFPSSLTATTTASGNAGDLTLKTRQLTIEDGGLVSSRSTETATGNPGEIDIETRSLSVTNNALITVEDRRTRVARQETEQVGNINIGTDSFTLDLGTISAETASTDGGNIFLNVQDSLLMRNDSRISTTAGTAGAGGNGGDIDINSQFIIAVPQENSDIRANAFEGRGGNVDIEPI
jgi:large exoprotein involved in heme utilization and adhesion